MNNYEKNKKFMNNLLTFHTLYMVFLAIFFLFLCMASTVGYFPKR